MQADRYGDPVDFCSPASACARGEGGVGGHPPFWSKSVAVDCFGLKPRSERRSHPVELRSRTKSSAKGGVGVGCEEPGCKRSSLQNKTGQAQLSEYAEQAQLQRQGRDGE